MMETTTIASGVDIEGFLSLQSNVNNRPLEMTRAEAMKLRRVLIGTKRGIDSILSIIEPKLGIDNESGQ